MRMKFSMEHLGLAARDPRALKDWYVRVLDAQCIFENNQSPPGYFVSFAAGSLIEIYLGDSAVPETGINSLAGWRHVAVQVESIETARTALEAKGVQFIDPVKSAGGGGRILFFRDGEGNLLHLVERPAGNSFRLTPG